MRLRPLLLCLPLLGLTACGDDPAPQLAQLRQELPLGLSLAEVQTRLQTRGTTFTLRSRAECADLVSQGRVQTQLSPRGGPCIFGKLPLARHWYGGRSDVILQLVFTRDGMLADGSFEAISSLQ